MDTKVIGDQKRSPSGKMLLEIMNRVSDGIVAFDIDFNYTFVNQKGGKLLGRQPSELIGKNYWKEYPEAKGSPIANSYLRSLETQKPIIIEDYYAPRKRWFENRIYPAANGLIIYFTEITDRKKAKEFLEVSEEKYRTLFYNAPDAFFQGDQEGNFILANQSATKLTGYSVKALLKMNMKDLFSEKELSEKPLRYDALKEKKNIQSEERFRLAFKTNPDSITISRLSDGLYLDINDGFTLITGYTQEDVRGKTSADINIWNDPNDREKLIQELRKNGVVRNLEVRFRIKNDGLRTGLMSASILNLNGEKVILNITRDITELRETENELIQSYRRYQNLFQDAPIPINECQN